MGISRLLFYSFLLYTVDCSVQRANVGLGGSMTLQGIEPKMRAIVENHSSRSDCQYTDFRWSSCMCETNLMIGVRTLIEGKYENCSPEVTIIELPCDKSSCNQKLLSTSDGVSCPSLANIYGACEPSKNFLADVMAKSFEACRTFCSVMVHCTHFIIDRKNSRCRLYSGNKICGRESPGMITGLAGFDANPCSECSVGIWGGLSECKKPDNFNPELSGCGEAIRTRTSEGSIEGNCPYRLETWTCSLPGQSCDMRTEVSDLYLKSSLEDDRTDSYRLLEISLIFAGIVTGLLMFVPISLIFPKIGVFFYGKRLYYLLSGNKVDDGHDSSEEAVTNIEDYDEWEDDLNIEYETEFTVENRQ
ncbi:TSP1 domain-containing protein TSP6 precursor [Cryptosporidium felis]|nr:TSP1 domain-containing protein TSP6 precursor [Cryptosporidium felis]